MSEGVFPKVAKVAARMILQTVDIREEFYTMAYLIYKHGQLWDTYVFLCVWRFSKGK